MKLREWDDTAANEWGSEALKHKINNVKHLLQKWAMQLDPTPYLER